MSDSNTNPASTTATTTPADPGATTVTSAAPAQPPIITPAAAPGALLTGEYGAAVSKFAATAGIPVERVATAFEKIAGAPSPEALQALRDPEAATDGDFITQLSEFPGARVRMALKELRGANAQTVAQTAGTAQQAQPATTQPMVMFSLPGIPDGGSLTRALVAGGLSKVDPIHVVGAIRAHFAKVTGMLDLDDHILKLVENRLTNLEEPASPMFLKIQRAARRRKFSDELSALDEIFPQATPSNADQQRLLENVASILIPAIRAFFQEASTWRASILGSGAGTSVGMANALLPMIMNASMNPRAAALANSAAAPTADVMRVAVKSVNTAVNRTFAALGIPTAAYIVERARYHTQLLKEPELRGVLGAANEEELLTLLKVRVDPKVDQTEDLLTRLAFGILKFEETPAGTDQEFFYLASLLQLGDQITWDNIFPEKRDGGGSTTNSAAARRNGAPGSSGRSVLG